MDTDFFKSAIYFFYPTKPETGTTGTTGTSSARRRRKAKRDAQMWVPPAAKALCPTTPTRYIPSLGLHGRVAGWAAVRDGGRATAGTTG